MTTRATLIADLRDWGTAADLTDAQASTVIRLAEATIARDIVTQAQESVAVVSVSSQAYPLPDNVLSVKALSLTGDRKQLAQYTPQQLHDLPEYSEAGEPRAFCIEGRAIHFAPAPAVATDVRMTLVVRFPPLLADSDTNWLLINHYDLVLAAGLMHVYALNQDDEQAAKWRGAYQSAVDALKQREALGRIKQPMQRRITTGLP